MGDNSQKKIVIYWDNHKTISFICAILLIPIILVLLFSATLKSTIINPNYYKNNLKKVDTYNRVINEVVPALVMDLTNDNQALSNSLAQNLLAMVIQKSIDPAWLESLADKTIDEAVNYFDKSTSYGDKITLNLEDSSTILKKISDGLILLEQMVPTCTEGQTTDDTTGLISCQNKTINVNELKTEIAGLRAKVNKVDLGVVNVNEQITKTNSYLLAIKSVIRNINVFFYISLMLAIGLILTIIFLEYRNLALLLKLISLPSALGALLGLVLMWLIKSLSSMTEEISLTNLPTSANALINDILQANISGVFSRFELIAGLILGIFGVIYIVVLVLEKTSFNFFGLKEK